MNIGSQIQSFLRRTQFWLSQAQITPPDDTLTQPPKDLVDQLEQAISQLSSPASYSTAVRSALTAALSDWQQNSDAPNSLVMLGCPVEPIGAIVEQSLAEFPLTEVQLVTPLTDWRRSPNPTALYPQLQIALGPLLTAPAAVDELVWHKPAQETERAISAGGDRPMVVVIPCLEDCFLRCIQGWESIEYLQNVIVQDSSRFWLIGCNTWAWAFLDRVCQIRSYLGNVQTLPEMGGPDLQAWLAAVAPDLMIQPAATEAEDLDYWYALAKVASGIGSVAAQFWVRGLRLQSVSLPESASDPSSSESLDSALVQERLQRTNPTSPRLPELTALDRYLLHSLLLHGGMTRSHLVLSLGETEGRIRARLETLQRAGVIVQEKTYFRVHPAHYLNLRTDLRNNNFLIGED